MCDGELFSLIQLLENVEGFLLLALVGVETLAVVVVLDAVEHATRRAEVLEYPGRGACQSVNLVEHSGILYVEVLLELLRPALVLGTMQTILGTTTKLADDNGLVVGDLPFHLGRVIDVTIPTYVLVEGNDIDMLVHVVVQAVLVV